MFSPPRLEWIVVLVSCWWPTRTKRCFSPGQFTQLLTQSRTVRWGKGSKALEMHWRRNRKLRVYRRGGIAKRRPQRKKSDWKWGSHSKAWWLIPSSPTPGRQGQADLWFPGQLVLHNEALSKQKKTGLSGATVHTRIVLSRATVHTRIILSGATVYMMIMKLQLQNGKGENKTTPL